MGLGSLTEVKLAAARQKAAECRQQRLEGIDPIDAREGARRLAEASASLAAIAVDNGVPVARLRVRPWRLTRPWRSSTAWMVLLAGTRTWLSRRRTRSSRILRAPQFGLSRLRETIRLSTWAGSWLANRTGRLERS